MTKRYKGEEKAVKEENRTASQKTKGKISTRRRLYRHISYGFPDFGWESSVCTTRLSCDRRVVSPLCPTDVQLSPGPFVS